MILEGGGGHICGRVARLATRQGLRQFSTQTLLPPHDPLALWRELKRVMNNQKGRGCMRKSDLGVRNVFDDVAVGVGIPIINTRLSAEKGEHNRG